MMVFSCLISNMKYQRLRYQRLSVQPGNCISFLFVPNCEVLILLVEETDSSNQPASKTQSVMAKCIKRCREEHPPSR